MKTKKISNGFEIPIIGIGTCLIGGEDYGPKDTSKDSEYIESIKNAINLGYNHIDTAEIYGGNHTEEIIGKAIKDFDRKKLFITTKVSKYNLKYDDVINSAKNSLKRLGIKYIDLYLIHGPNEDIPIEETMKAMNYLVKEKLVKYIGVSSFNIKQIKEAQKYSKQPIVVNQLKFSIYKKSDTKTIKYCQKNNIIVTGYKIFGRGMINTEENNILEKLVNKYNKTKSQILLNWTVSKENMVAIFKSTNIKHLKDNLKSFDFELTNKEKKSLDNLVKPLF